MRGAGKEHRLKTDPLVDGPRAVERLSSAALCATEPA
jgi:hypothetical protein